MRMGSVESDDIEFWQLLEDRRHKELVTLLEKVLKKEQNPNKDILDAINKQNGILERLISAVSILKMETKVEAPEVNVQMDHQKIVDAVGKSANRMMDGLSEMKACLERIEEDNKKRRNVEFKIVRSRAGIDTIKPVDLNG